MRSRLVLPLAIVLPLIVFLLAATRFWGRHGWRIGETPVPPEIGGAGLAPTFIPLLCMIATAGLLIAAGLQLTLWLTARNRNSIASIALAFLIGHAVCAMLLGFAAFVVMKSGLLVIVALVVMFAARASVRSFRDRWRAPVSIEALAVVPFLLLAGFAALAPAVESDGLRYHLTAPSEWLREGHFVLLPYSANSNLPASAGLITASIAPREHLGRAYQLIQFLHYGALLIIAGELARCVYRSIHALRRRETDDDSRAGERIATGMGMLAAAGIPAAAILAAWPFSDIAAVALLLGGVWISLPGVVRACNHRLLLTSLLLGGAVSAKLSLLPVAALAALWPLLRLGWNAAPRIVLLRVVLLVVPGMLVLAPWLIKNTVYHGNPVYPVAWSVFGGPEWSADNDLFYREKMKEKGLGEEWSDLLATPFQMTVNWPAFEGFNPGPFLPGLLPAALLAALAALLMRGRLSPVLFLGFVLIAGWIAWFRTYQSVRFFLPMLILIVVMGAGLLAALAAWLPLWPRSGIRVVVTACALAGAVWAPIYHSRVSHVYRAAGGRTGEDVYIDRRFDGHSVYTAILWLNANTKNNEPVFYIGEHRMFYAWNFRPVGSDWFDTPRVLVEIRETADNDELLDRWREQGMRYVLLNLGELSLYEVSYFRPRFTDEEWERFMDLRQRLLETVTYDTGRGVYVSRIAS